jgi:hypothetical protein
VEVWELIAREQIRHTLAAYSHAGDRLRLDDLASAFTPSGVLEAKGRYTARGRDEIVRILSGATSARRPPDGSFFIRHFTSNVLIRDVTRTQASAESYFAVYTPRGLDHWGRYRDLLVPAGDRWLISHRLAAVDASVPGSWFANEV